jgi:hypothetical protein
VGREQLGAFYRRLDQVYAAARRIYLVQDNWSIHHHADMVATLRQLPRLEPIWLPTSAPWLNPIEPKWVHGKRAIVQPDRLLSAHEVADRAWAYFGCPHEGHLIREKVS